MSGKKRLGQKVRKKKQRWQQWNENHFRNTATASEFKIQQKKKKSIAIVENGKKKSLKREQGRMLVFFLSWLVFPGVCCYPLHWLEWFGPFCLLFLLPCVMIPKWAEPVQMEVMSNCDRQQLPWSLHVPHPESAERAAKYLSSNQSLGIGIKLYIKDLSSSKIQYNWPAAGPSRKVTRPASHSVQ